MSEIKSIKQIPLLQQIANALEKSVIGFLEYKKKNINCVIRDSDLLHIIEYLDHSKFPYLYAWEYHSKELVFAVKLQENDMSDNQIINKLRDSMLKCLNFEGSYYNRTAESSIMIQFLCLLNEIEQLPYQIMKTQSISTGKWNWAAFSGKRK